MGEGWGGNLRFFFVFTRRNRRLDAPGPFSGTCRGHLEFGPESPPRNHAESSRLAPSGKISAGAWHPPWATRVQQKLALSRPLGTRRRFPRPDARRALWGCGPRRVRRVRRVISGSFSTPAVRCCGAQWQVGANCRRSRWVSTNLSYVDHSCRSRCAAHNSSGVSGAAFKDIQSSLTLSINPERVG